LKFKAKKIALFGTSADPPTNGHKKIIEELSKIFSLVISYASDNPSKEHQESLTFRSLLLKSLIEDLKNPNVFFDQELSSPWAIKTIKKCKLKYNTENIKFVIGSDLIEQIISWKNFNEIIKECDLFIIPREGYLINPRILKKIEENKGRYIISSFKVPNVSSSMIREKNLQLELPKSIVEIIKHKNLYKNLK
tara:strand:- start:103 stop:681 length:579 start_codon:yes stop_codon:yes gene_type:complete